MGNKKEEYGQMPPPYPPYGYPHYQVPPHYPHPGYYHGGPHGPHPMHGYHHAHAGYPPHFHQMGHGEPSPQAQGPDPLTQQAQSMVEGMLGEQAGLFKELTSKLGVDDKEFWKGAMIGAAAALIIGNPEVRQTLMGLLGGAGDLFKTGQDSAMEPQTEMDTEAPQQEEELNNG